MSNSVDNCLTDTFCIKYERFYLLLAVGITIYFFSLGFVIAFAFNILDNGLANCFANKAPSLNIGKLI